LIELYSSRPIINNDSCDYYSCGELEEIMIIIII